MPILRIAELSAGYEPRRPVLHSIDLEVKHRELIAILGASGSGKSTLLRAAAGLLLPFKGRILLEDRLVHDIPPRERRIGFVFQHLALFPTMTVAENVAFGLRYTALDTFEADKRLAQLLGSLDLANVGQRLPNALSGGQAQRVALARALAMEPSLLFLDEPFSSLDRPLADAARALVMRLHREHFLTTLLVTHDREQALTIADRVVILGRDGRIHQDSAPAAVYNNPRTLEAAQLSGPLNQIHARCERFDRGRVIATMRNHDRPIELLASWPHASTPLPGDDLVIAFRPEWAFIRQMASTTSTAAPVAQITQSVLSGRRLFISCSLGRDECVVENHSAFTPAIGDTVFLEIDHERAIAYPTRRTDPC